MENFDSDDSGNENAFQNPPKRVQQTTTAKVENTSTTLHSATSFNENSRKVIYQTTRQTVTHQQKATKTEINTVQFATSREELEKAFEGFDLSNIDHDSPRGTQLTNSFELPTGATKRNPSVFKTETVTRKSGSEVFCTVEEQKIKLSNPKALFNTLFNIKTDSPVRNAGGKTTNSSPYTTKQNIFKPKTDAEPFTTTKIPNDKTTTNFPNSPIRTASFSSFFSPQSTSSEENLSTNSSDTASNLSQFEIPMTPSARARQKSFLKPGFAFIFNNETFDDPKNGVRFGSDADVNSLIETFKMFKLSVEIHKNAPLAKIKSVVKTVANKDFKKYACLVIAILTHGSRNERVQARDKSYSIDDDMLFPLTKNATLSNKPKILFIQACKGSIEVSDFHKDTEISFGMPSEILKCYSTFEGYVSYRTEQGTFFIQKLCEQLKKYGETESIEVIMRSVTAAVKSFTGGKQIPTMTVNLTEPFIFGGCSQILNYILMDVSLKSDPSSLYFHMNSSSYYFSIESDF